MAYDSESDQVILVAGTDANTWVTLNDTWAYDYEFDTWTELAVKNPITPHHFADMAYVPEADRIILFGGLASPGEDQWTVLGDTWSFDYNTLTWTLLEPAGAPTPRAYHTLTCDPAGGDLILFGGTTAHENYPHEPTTDETWRYDIAANTWLQLSPTSPPSSRARHQAIGTPVGLLLFGGGDDRERNGNDTWLFSSAEVTWRLIP